MTIPPDVVLLFSYIRGYFVTVRFYRFGSILLMKVSFIFREIHMRIFHCSGNPKQIFRIKRISTAQKDYTTAFHCIY